MFLMEVFKMKNNTWVLMFSLFVFVAFLAGCANNTGEAVALAKNQTNKTGNLFVSSIPSGAGLYVDNSYKGLTPSTVYGLLVGNHAVKVTKSGYNSYTATKYIYAGQATSLNVTLTLAQNYTNQTNSTQNVTHKVCSGTSCVSVGGAGVNQCTSNAQCGTSNQTNQTNQTGSLYVYSMPAGASLYVDNYYRGLTPSTVYGLLVGNHAVKVTKSGYTDYATTKYIYKGSNYLNVT